MIAALNTAKGQRAERARVRALARQVDAARLAVGLAVAPALDPALGDEVLDHQVDGLLLGLWREHLVERAGSDELEAWARERGLGDATPALDALLAHAPSATLAERLARAHELTIARRLSRTGDRVELVPSGSKRRHGVYYTPADVVAFMVEETLGAALAPLECALQAPAPDFEELLAAARALKVLDPACGGGAFLLGALRRLRRFYRQLAVRWGATAPVALTTPGRLTLETNLFGVDLDARALALAELALLAAARADADADVDVDPDVGPPGLVGATLRVGDHLETDGFSHRAAFPQVFGRAGAGFDVVVGNPPYAPLSAERKAQADAAGFRAAKSGDLFALFVEGMTRLAAPGGRGGLIVPLSLLFSRATRALREHVLLPSGRRWRLASFDRIPSGLFEAEVRARTTIALMDPRRADGVTRLETTPLLRFAAEDRPTVFEELAFVDATPTHHPALGLPKLGSALQAEWLERLLARGQRLGDACSRRGEHLLHFKQNCYGFMIVSAELPPAWDDAGAPAAQTKYGALRFAREDQRDAALALLAGRWSFWWWLVYGDGFDVTTQLIGAFPVDPTRLPSQSFATLAELGRAIQHAVREHVAVKKNGGKRIGTYDLRRCRELTDRADALLAEALGAEALLADVRSQLAATHGAG